MKLATKRFLIISAGKYFLFNFILLITFSPLSNSQNIEPKFEHLTLKDGLPENSVRCILQDHHGYLWFGTQNGLVRYDGYSMKVYQPASKDSLSISARLIHTIYEDKSGTLWIGTYSSGLNCFDRSTETFVRYIHNPNDSTSINNNAITCIGEDKNENLLVGTLEGLNLFDRKNKCFSHIYYNSSIYSMPINAIIEDQLTGNIYVGGVNEILIYDSEERVLKRKNDIIGSESDLGVINSFYQSFDGTIWVGHSKGLARFNSLLNTIENYQPTVNQKNDIENNIDNLFEDDDGLIWGSRGGYYQGEFRGIICFDSYRERFQRFENEPGNSIIESRNRVWSLYKDRSGVIWAGTWGFGLHKWDCKKYKFKRMNYYVENNQGYNRILSLIEEVDGIIWLGTDYGLVKFDRLSGKLRLFKYNPKIKDNPVMHIYKDDSGIIWCGTSNGLAKFNPAFGTFKCYSNNPVDSNSIDNNIVNFILPDGNGVLWVGTSSGLNRFVKKTGKFSRYAFNFSLPLLCIYKDQVEKIWLGFDGGGLISFDQYTGIFKEFRFEAESEFTSILTIYEDLKRNFWIGTYHSGLYLLDRDKGISIRNITEKDGLPNNHVSSILEGTDGNLWIGTRNGLARLNPQTHSIKNFFTSNDFESNSYFYRSAFKTSTGEMLFGTYDGFIVFHPNSIKDDPVPPQVVIENISLFNRPDEKLDYEDFIPDLERIELPYDQNDLHFEYVGLHFSEPLKNKYKYILEGFDKNWIDARNLRTATYTNLDPGEYIFRVNAANRDGVWNRTGASIRIIINPPMWATTWAYLLYIILAISLAYYSWKLNVRRLKTKHEFEMSRFEAEKLHEVDELKSRFFANISHEFRTPLTLILGPVKDIIDKSKDTEIKQSAGLIKRNAGRLLGLVNQLLDLSKLEAGKMTLEAREQNIIPLFKGLVLSFSSLAERKKITLKFNAIEEYVNVYLDKDKIEKIVNNLLSNAFKFTPEGGRIEVSVEKAEKEVAIKIADSGVGIPRDKLEKIFDRFYQVDGSHTREQEGTGIGLALTKELVELHKGKIEVESEEGKGTTFIVKIPLGEDHLKPEEIVENKVKEDIKYKIDEKELIVETNQRKEKTDIDLLLNTDKPLLLVVEDNSDVRKYIISHLEEDYRIQEAVDGEDGVNQAFNHIPDLIISDVMMPKMDGFEMCSKLKTDERTSHIPIIMLTAKATSQDKISGYETGADDYIMKPFDTTELKVRVKNLIEIRRKLQEKFKSNDYSVPAELSSIDEQFMKRVLNIINEHISEEEFSIDELGKEVAMSRQHLYRKLKAISGKSPSLFIRSVKLAKAKKLIKERKGTISEISFAVGFGSPAYFDKCFKEEFGYSPGELTQ